MGAYWEGVSSLTAVPCYVRERTALGSACAGLNVGESRPWVPVLGPTNRRGS